MINSVNSNNVASILERKKCNSNGTFTCVYKNLIMKRTSSVNFREMYYAIPK